MSDSKSISKLVIDRAWWSGIPTNPGPSRLLNDFGVMCCLGFLGRACGVSDERLRPSAMPTPGMSEFPLAFRTCPDGWCDPPAAANRAAELNDAHINIKEKEEQLTLLFAENGIELVFEGEAQKYEASTHNQAPADATVLLSDGSSNDMGQPNA